LALINAHAHADQVRRYVDDLNARGEVRWEVAEEERLLGSAGTLARHLARLEEHQHYLVVYADNLSDMDLGAFLRAHRAGGGPATLALFSAPVPERCGVVELGEGGVVASFQEKPPRPTSNLAFAGVAAFSRGALVPGEIPEVGDLAGDLLPQLVGRARGWLWPGYHRDVGTPQDLTGAEEDLRAGRFQTRPESRA
jgi:mannose-1-phosphate guanylyltransferase